MSRHCPAQRPHQQHSSSKQDITDEASILPNPSYRRNKQTKEKVANHFHVWRHLLFTPRRREDHRGGAGGARSTAPLTSRARLRLQTGTDAILCKAPIAITPSGRRPAA